MTATPSAVGRSKELPSEVLVSLDGMGKVFTTSTLASILRQNRTRWGIPRGLSFPGFAELLLRHKVLDRLILRTPAGAPHAVYVRGEPSPYEVALALRSESYLSHATAAYLHGLSSTLPTVVYVNKEQALKRFSPPILSQESIDRAFSRPQRRSNQILSFGLWSLVMLNGKHTGRVGVADTYGPKGELLHVTTLERTLIDLAVRPVYGGGVHEVLAAFKSARQKLSSSEIPRLLAQLSYTYPYHQVIGFYTERAGYASTVLDSFRALPMDFDFYLAHGIEAKTYDRSWRLYYPRGL